MSCLRTLGEGSSHNVVRLFSLGVGSRTCVRLFGDFACLFLGVLLDILEACKVACSGALLTSSNSFDPFWSWELQSLVIG